MSKLFHIHVIYNVFLDTKGNIEERKDRTEEVCPQKFHLILQLEGFLCTIIVNEQDGGKFLWIYDCMSLCNIHAYLKSALSGVYIDMQILFKTQICFFTR